jgi:RimJ/RimL family protein N-acetyltransferase
VLIETERLCVRPLSIADLDEFAALHVDPEVTRFVRARDREQAVERLHTDQREWQDRGHGLLVILDRETGRFLGRVAPKYWPQFDETEVGWVLRRDASGHGIATEAARVCAGWGFRDFAVAYLTATIRPGNTRSINVAERLGMAQLRTDILADVPVVVYAVSRKSWRPTVRERD